MSLGILLLSIWLVVTGLLAFVRMSFPSREKVMGIIAIAAGVLLLLGR